MNTDNYSALVAKYNVAAPRYTSYPTVPYWNTDNWQVPSWLASVRQRFEASVSQGISIYMHLPFCESLCTYCGCNTRITKNHGVEQPYITAVLNEWELYRYHLQSAVIPIRDVHLGGGTPTFFGPHELRRLMEGILRNGQASPDASFSFEAHPANTTADHLRTLFDLGFRRLSLGIQDFDVRVQHMINRKQSEADVWRVLDDARRIGYTSINFDLIYGLPLQTTQSVVSTVGKALAMRPDRISFYGYAHVPWMRPGQRRFTEADLPMGNDKLLLYCIGKRLIMDAGYRDVGMDHFALPEDDLVKAVATGMLHRNFMGYTDRYSPLLLGLGVSSISDSWDAFAQNIKSVEAYQAAIASGQFPLLKGHILTAGDRLLRQHILDIMCKGHTTLAEDSLLTGRVLRRLGGIRNDGLVNITGTSVSVTPIGFSFLRNICMAFDERMHLGQVGEQTFSKAV